jgi:C_GCAxxG_C_C family probable redox protein
MEKLIEEGFFSDADLNCAETILHAANEVYGWNLSHDALLLAAGFGGGVGGQEFLCGALLGGVMALSKLFVRDRGHESDLMKTIRRTISRVLKMKWAISTARRLKKLIARNQKDAGR